MTPMLSHPNLRDGVEARAYQLLAAKQAVSGSTLLVMPTGLGKTAVQWMAMANALNGMERLFWLHLRLVWLRNRLEWLKNS